MRRLTPLLCLLLAPLALAKPDHAEPSPGANLEVHEWGTFTAVAGADGQAMVWKPLSGPSDLPDFVYDFTDVSEGRRDSECHGKGCSGTIRMETPVIYFHTDEAMEVEVQVFFPKGQMTEWYPKARVPDPNGLIWGRILLDPNLPTDFIDDGSESHYYPARETSATPLRVCDASGDGSVVGAETERFLFYRGVGDFPLSLKVRLDESEQLHLDGHRGLMLVFENTGDELRWQWLDSSGSSSTGRPQGSGELPVLLSELAVWLDGEGLNEDEAWAMVRTWEDSWFEPGLRVLYVLPDAEVDELLPLTIVPEPARTERVLVGRVEVITPEMQAEARQIGDSPEELEARFGRFAEPVAASLAW